VKKVLAAMAGTDRSSASSGLSFSECEDRLVFTLYAQ
jgi:hypothetical protein